MQSSHLHLQFDCIQCSEVSKSKSSLYQHVRVMHRNIDKKYKCDVCDKLFLTQYKLKVHNRSHTGERPYACKQCEKSYSESGKLNLHMKTHTGEKPFECLLCGMKYPAPY